jgi:hypothetical protein
MSLRASCRSVCGYSQTDTSLSHVASPPRKPHHFIVGRLLNAFEKAPASIAAIAISIAAGADFASTPVTNLASCRRLVVIIMAFPLVRSTLARHLPGSRSKACTLNCLYSMANDFDCRRYQYQRPRPCNAAPAATMIVASIMRIAIFISPAGRAKRAHTLHPNGALAKPPADAH